VSVEAVQTVRISKLQALHVVDTLGPTERAVVDVLLHVHVATLDQLGLAASTAATEHDRAIVAGRAVAKLERLGFVIRYPIDVRGSKKQVALALSNGAVAAVTLDRVGDPVKRRERRDLRLVNSRILDHALGVSGIYAAFAAARAEGMLARWEHDEETISFVDGGSLRRIRADAYGIWRWHGGEKQTFFIEYEKRPRRRETSEKIRQYYRYFYSGHYIRREASKLFPTVLFVTPDNDAANTALHAIRWTNIHSSMDEYFKIAVTTTGLIRRQGITGNIWYIGTEAYTLADTAATSYPPMFESRGF